MDAHPDLEEDRHRPPGMTSRSAGRVRLNRFSMLFVLVLLIGLLARLWEFRSLPPGLRADETLAALDAFDLYRFGVDHNGDAYPLVMVGGGSGVSALYAYLLIPSIAIGGMNALSVRIPILIAGISALPLMFAIGRRIAGSRLGLFAMFLLAISPWHILASRRGHEAHLLPFIFLVAFACLLKSTADNHWFVPAAALYALCLYAYAPAYAAVPIFLALAVIVLLITHRVSPLTLVSGLVVFALLAAPVGVFLIINSRELNTIRAGFFTIPRLPAKPRFESQSTVFGGLTLSALWANVAGLVSLLWKQTDGLAWNSVEPYGYFYRYTFPVAVVGAGLFVPLRNIKGSAERLLVLAWLVSAAVLGLLQPANINRINLIFIPLLLCIAMCLEWLFRHSKPALAASLVALMVGFALFTRDYHGARYRDEADYFFYSGFLDALDYARQASDDAICVTNEGVDEPYVFALFLEQLNPADYLPTLTYADPEAAFRHPDRLGRYQFGVKHCGEDSPDAVYLLHQTEAFSGPLSYTVHAFGSFRVYTP